MDIVCVPCKRIKEKTEKGQMECFTSTIDIPFCGGKKKAFVQEQRPSNGTSKAICHVSLALVMWEGTNRINKLRFYVQML